MKLVVARGASADLERLHDFLADKDQAAAQHAISLLVEAVESLAIFPNRGRRSGVSNIRELIIPFGQSAYVLRYAYSAKADEVTVLRIWHGREARK